ncbi:hypothetical protein OGATHE_001295 [Ogataea polymorpha]|uniref:RSE1/DDB1/CPSF1 first beta-propeller domain-containing protein n=1 Tax=Ogataea polymorpha TaxID=460523 RepID=A0A9P8TFL3_9ASCO|nr:hypothetical protein OGATHE_001295 [Ogataea polymorpha]
MSFNVRKLHDGAIVECLVVDFYQNDTLVVAHPYSIELLDHSYKQLDVLELQDRIMAMNHIRPPGLQHDWLLVLTQNNQLVVIAWNDGFILLQEFHIESVANTIEVHPFIRVDDLGRYILIYSNEGYMAVLELHPSKTELFRLALQNEPPSQVKKRPDAAKLQVNRIFEKPQVLYIGHGVVHSAVFLKTRLLTADKEGTVFAIVVRNANLKYSVNYYGIGQEISLIKRLPQMNSVPSLAIPLSLGALLVICEDMHYLFPAPAVRSISSSVATTTRQYATKELFSGADGKMAKLLSWCFDGRYYWFSSEQGDIYQMEIELDSESLEAAENNLDLSIAERLRAGNSRPIGLEVNKWNIERKQQVDLLHKMVYRGNRVIGCNHFGLLIEVDRNTQLLKQVRQADNLPITAMNGKYYAQGTYLSSKVVLDDWKNLTGLVKEIVETDDFVVLVVEEHEVDLEIEEIKRTDRLEVYKAGEKIGEHWFDAGIVVRKVLPVPDLLCQFEEKSKISNDERYVLQTKLSKCFIVLVNDEEDQSGLLLMRFVDDEWKQEGHAVVNKLFDSIIQVEDYSLLLIGPHSLVWTRIYGGPSFWFQNEECNSNIPVLYFSEWKKLENGDLVVGDAFSGLYLFKIDRNERKVSVIQILKNVMVTDFTVFRQNLVVGDLMGNIFIIGLQGEPKMVHQSYLGHGAITCVETLDELVRVGTSEGLLVIQPGPEKSSRFPLELSSLPHPELNENLVLEINNN